MAYKGALMIEDDEMSCIDDVYEELIEEGYSEDEVEFGIETALTTLDEDYYDSAVAASKAKSQAAPAPKRSLKDRIKSVAKKAITRGAYAAGRAMKAKAKVQAAPDRAKKKVRSIADRVKSAAKAGYAAGRGPVEKKSKTAYRGAGVGRKEKIGEERGPCWQGYKQVGMKKKGNKTVPNCVPESAESIEEGIGMTMAKAVGNPPALSNRMKLKQALLNREIKKNAAKNKKKSYSGKAVSEAVKGQDTESRKEAAAERKKGDKRLSPSKGKGYADQQKQSIAYHDKVSKKNKIIPGMTHEAVDATPYGGPDKLLQKLAPKHGGGQVVPFTPKKSANVQKAHFEPEGEMIEQRVPGTPPPPPSQQMAAAKALKDLKKKQPNPNPVRGIDEKVERYNELGQTVAVTLRFRGKIFYLQLFFPTVKFPNRKEVEAQVQKIYPDAVVMMAVPATVDPTKPTIRVAEEVLPDGPAPDKRNPQKPKRKTQGGDVREVVDEASPTGYNKGERYTGKAGAMSPEEIRRANQGIGDRIRSTIPGIKLQKAGYEPEGEMVEGAAWTKKSGKNPKGGLNEKGRRSYEAENPGSDLKRPSKKPGNKRRDSFCKRMKGMKKKLTSSKTANDPDSRINKSLRAWNC